MIAQANSGANSFPAYVRLHKTDEFSSVFAFRKTVRGAVYVIHYRPAQIAGIAKGVNSGNQAEIRDARIAHNTEVIAGVAGAAVAITYARLGVVVPRRHVKLATDRNLLKRIVREAFRQVRGRLKPMDLVVRVMTPVEIVSHPAQTGLRVRGTAKPDRRAKTEKPVLHVDKHVLRAEIDGLFAKLIR